MRAVGLLMRTALTPATIRRKLAALQARGAAEVRKEAEARKISEAVKGGKKR